MTKQRKMKALSSLVVAILLLGCATQKRCFEKFPPQTIDSIRTWVTYSCDSFPVYISYQELIFDTSGIIPANIVFHHKQTSGSLTQTLDIVNGRIIQECHEDSLRRYIEYLKETIHEKESNVKIVKEFKLFDRWYLKPLIWWFVLSLVVIIGWLVMLYLKVKSFPQEAK